MRIFVYWFLVETPDKAEAKRLSAAISAKASLDAWPQRLTTGVIDGVDLNKLESLLRPKKAKGESKRPGVGGKHLLGMDPDKPIVSHVNDSFLEHLAAIDSPAEVLERWRAADGLESTKPADLQALLGELIAFAKRARGKPVLQVDVG
jgi:hypothetical protein